MGLQRMEIIIASFQGKFPPSPFPESHAVAVEGISKENHLSEAEVTSFPLYCAKLLPGCGGGML